MLSYHVVYEIAKIFYESASISSPDATVLYLTLRIVSMKGNQKPDSRKAEVQRNFCGEPEPQPQWGNRPLFSFRALEVPPTDVARAFWTARDFRPESTYSCMAEQPSVSLPYTNSVSWRTCAGGRTAPMAAKKKTKKKQTKSKRTAGNKMTPMKKTAKKKLAMKRKTPKKELAKKAAQKKATVKTKAAGKKTIGVKTATALKKQVRAKSQSVDTVAFSPEGPGARSGRQSGTACGRDRFPALG